MTTLPPPATNYFPEDSVEKKVYGFVERLAEFIPVPNDRNRLGYNLVKYVQGEGDKPEILVKSTKIKIVGIEPAELVKKIESELKNLNR